MRGIGATRAFGRRPLSRGYRPFTGPTTKVAFGSGLASSPSRVGMTGICVSEPWIIYEAFTRALKSACVADADGRVLTSGIPLRLL